MGEAVRESEVSHIIAVPQTLPPGPWPSLSGCLRRAAGLAATSREAGLWAARKGLGPPGATRSPISLQGGWDLDCVSVGSGGGRRGSGYWLSRVWGWGRFAGSSHGGRIARVGSGDPQLDHPPARQLPGAATRCDPSLGLIPSTGWAPRGDSGRVRWERRRQRGLMSDLIGFVPLSPQLSQGSDIATSVDRTSSGAPLTATDTFFQVKKREGKGGGRKESEARDGGQHTGC